MDLTVDPNSVPDQKTGVYVRALRNGVWESVDIAELDKASLLTFFMDRDPLIAINMIGILLGHGHLIEGAGPHCVMPDGKP